MFSFYGIIIRCFRLKSRVATTTFNALSHHVRRIGMNVYWVAVTKAGQEVTLSNIKNHVHKNYRGRDIRNQLSCMIES